MHGAGSINVPLATSFALDYPQLFRYPRKRWKYHCTTGFLKTPEWFVKHILLLVYHCIHFSFFQFNFLMWDVMVAFEIDKKSLKTRLFALAKYKRCTN